MFLIDSHCHLDKLNYQTIHLNVADVINKAYACDVKLILSVCTTLSDFYSMIKLIGNRADVLFSCGVHPLHIEDKYDFSELLFTASKTSVVALGETGLDYYHRQDNKLQQQKALIDHISIGRKLNKPLIVHTRYACKDTLNILRSEQADQCGGILHCFSEDLITAKTILDFGFYISISGMITFQNMNNLRNVVNYIPLNRLLLETDAPYLTPVPFRGKENQPAYIRHIAKIVANIKQISILKLANATTNNFMRLFNLDIQHYSKSL